MWDRSIEELRDLLIGAAAAASVPLEELVYQCKGSVVLEAERIHPELAHRLRFQCGVRSIFVIEHEAERLYRTLKSRSRSFSLLSESRRRKVADVNRAYGEWLEEQCFLLGIPTLSSSPWDTLANRIVRCCGLDRISNDTDYRPVGDPVA